jgi:hypothetical protein
MWLLISREELRKRLGEPGLNDGIAGQDLYRSRALPPPPLLGFGRCKPEYVSCAAAYAFAITGVFRLIIMLLQSALRVNTLFPDLPSIRYSPLLLSDWTGVPLSGSGAASMLLLRSVP